MVVPKGEPSNFLSDEEIRSKYESLVGPYLPAERARGLADGLLGLDEVSDARTLISQAAAGPASELRVAMAGD